MKLNAIRRPLCLELLPLWVALGGLWLQRAEAVQFQPLQDLQIGLGFATALTFGPEDPDPLSSADGCIYAVNGSQGAVHRICFDSSKVVTSDTVVIDLNGSGGVNYLLGITFDPSSDPNGEMHLYLAYADNNSAPFNGKIAHAVSMNGGVTYTVDEDFITGLPRMQQSSHQTNGLQFGPDDCLYIAQGNNSNAGYDSAAAESHLSSAILRVCFKNPAGDVDPTVDRNCGGGNTQEACAVEVYASGLRNPYDLVWHSNGLLYSTDNDANDGPVEFRNDCLNPANTFGCPSCQRNEVEPLGDEINLIEHGLYYGSPNPYRANPSGLQCQGGTDGGDACTVDGDCDGGGTCEDLSTLCTDSICDEDVQCFYFSNNEPPEPGEDPNGLYREPIAQVPALLDGIAEYRAPFGNLLLGGFCSDWDGALLVTGAGGSVRRFVLANAGQTATHAGTTNLNGAAGLDVAVGPDGTIYVADFNGGKVTYLEPITQPVPGQPEFFELTQPGEPCPEIPECGNNIAEAGQECDGTDDAACGEFACLSNCTCAQPTQKVVQLRADLADGIGPYPIPGIDSPWVDVADSHDAVLGGFVSGASSGWRGDGASLSPYRLQFDGVDDRVTIPVASVPELQSTTAYTFTVWFRTSADINSNQYLVEWLQEFESPFRGITVGVAGGILRTWLNPWVNIVALQPDTWYHVAVAKDAASVRVYVNGQIAFTGADSNLGSQLSEIVIGAGTFSGPGSYSTFWSGAIGQVYIFTGSLSNAEVLAEYQADEGLFVARGACCNEGTGDCTDDTLAPACQGLLQVLTPDTLCADLAPLCAIAPTGACCNSSGGICENGRFSAECQGQTQSWAEATLCADLIPICESVPQSQPLIAAGDAWRYFKGTVEPSPSVMTDWATLGFDDALWLTGPSGFGYGTDCLPFGTALGDMQDGYGSVYVRRLFNINDPVAVTELTLTIDYDDSYVAYLNGVEVGRNNVVGAPPTFDQLATVDRECSGSPGSPNPPEDVAIHASFDLSVLLQAGNNVIAIQGHNISEDSSDFTLLPTLTATQTPPTALPPTVDSTGSRYLAVTPPPGEASVALRVESGSIPCLPLYVDADGVLVDTPVFLSSAQWGTVYVADSAILPSTSYGVRADVRDPGSPPNLSAAGFATTWAWGDLNNVDDVNLFDIVSMLDAFQSIFVNATPESSDLRGDIPNRNVDLFDIVAVLDAFQDIPYPGIPCASARGVSASVDAAVLSVVPRSTTVRPGEIFVVDVYVSSTAIVRGYQLGFDPRSCGLSEKQRGRARPLACLVSMTVDTDRPDYIFRDDASYGALAARSRRLARATLSRGVAVPEHQYLGSATFRIATDAPGGTSVEIPLGSNTVLVDSDNKPIETTTLQEGTVATAKRKRARRTSR